MIKQPARNPRITHKLVNTDTMPKWGRWLHSYLWQRVWLYRRWVLRHNLLANVCYRLGPSQPVEKVHGYVGFAIRPTNMGMVAHVLINLDAPGVRGTVLCVPQSAVVNHDEYLADLPGVTVPEDFTPANSLHSSRLPTVPFACKSTYVGKAGE